MLDGHVKFKRARSLQYPIRALMLARDDATEIIALTFVGEWRKRTVPSRYLVGIASIVPLARSTVKLSFFYISDPNFLSETAPFAMIGSF